MKYIVLETDSPYLAPIPFRGKSYECSYIENASLGQNYATGIYTVIVSQGMNIKTVRLVKK